MFRASPDYSAERLVAGQAEIYRASVNLILRTLIV
jgi:hypothetical protein